MYAVTHSTSVEQLSIQEMLDCSFTYDGALFSCMGGDTCKALKWMLQVSNFNCLILLGTGSVFFRRS